MSGVRADRDGGKGVAGLFGAGSGARSGAAKLVGLVIGMTLTACSSAAVPAAPPPPPAPAPATPAPTTTAPPSGLAYGTAEPRLHVAPNGSDDNPGTAEAPLLTIGQAAEQATPGTTVVVADGTYPEVLATRASGRQDARITFTSATRWGAKLVGEGDGEGAVWRNYGDYVDIQGFEITGTLTDGILQAGSYGKIVDNRVHDLTEACISTNNDDYSMVDNDIIGNVVFRCGSSQLHHGIYPGGPGGIISNNISFGNPGYGIHCWHNCNRQVITNNLVFDNAEGGILIGQGDGPNYGDVDADDMLVANNIAIDNGSQGIQESGATGSNNRYLNNNVVGNAEDGLRLNTGTEVNTITTQPQFVNFQPDGSGDYRLLPSSPGIDAGTPDGAPAWDFVGAPRPQGSGVDIGVFER